MQTVLRIMRTTEEEDIAPGDAVDILHGTARHGRARLHGGGGGGGGEGGGRRWWRRMEFKQWVEAAEKWCSGNPFDLIFAEEDVERRLDFYAEPGISFYVLCPDHLTGGTDNFHVWSESEDCLPFLQLAQDYISSCGKKTLLEVLEKVFTSFRPLLGLPDIDDDSFEHYHADVEGEPGADHQQMGVSQQ
ncbi:hypothetical protein CRUP_033773 [Coryphaenoides rupestris]|nr:hypothetical protein CRUP_033773 [Coryphaenoides rupestris]